MIEIVEKEQCCGCNACGDICPKDAITFKVDNEGFWYPHININQCINCGLCEKTCQVIHSIELRENNYPDPNCYVAEHKSIDVVFSSTTGGMFSALAEVMYAQHGYVGGAIHNEDFSVSHFISNKKDDLKRLRRSKDLQSNAEGFYKNVSNILKQGEKVLVCGVPCQIAGLKAFLGKEYENLITVDLVCLGVNSPKVWRKYLDSIEEKYGSKIVETENKSKEYGWHNLTQKFTFENGEEAFDTIGTSSFIKGFIHTHLYCRPSCYECKFKGFPRVADISIGDFWGIEKHDPSQNKNMGTSLVLINTQKGREYFERVKKRIQYKEAPLTWATSGNPALTKSIDKTNVNREEFFSKLDDVPFEQLTEQYSKKNRKSKIQLIKSAIKFGIRIAKITRMNPKAIYQTIHYSGIRNLFHRRGIICSNNCILNISKSAKLSFKGLLVFGNKEKFPHSKLESRLYIGKNAQFSVLGDFTIDYGCDIEVFENAELTIHGKKLSPSDANIGLTIICGEKIEIMPDVGIGRNVLIRDTNGNHFMNTVGYKSSRAVQIGEKAWLCESCAIMPGVKIGRGGIVGAKAVVTKSVPNHALVSGYPAEVVQENVLWKCY